MARASEESSPGYPLGIVVLLLRSSAFADAQERPRCGAYPVSPAESRHGLPLAGAHAGIANIYSKTGEKEETAPQGLKRRMMSLQRPQQCVQEMRLRYGEP